MSTGGSELEMSSSSSPPRSLLTQSLLHTCPAQRLRDYESSIGNIATKIDNGDVVCTIQPISGDSKSTSTTSSFLSEIVTWGGHYDGDRKSPSDSGSIISRMRGGGSPLTSPPALRSANNDIEITKVFSSLNVNNLPKASVDILGTAPEPTKSWIESANRQLPRDDECIPHKPVVLKGGFLGPPKPIQLHAVEGRILFDQFPPLPDHAFELSTDPKNSTFVQCFESTLDAEAAVKDYCTINGEMLKLGARLDEKRKEAIRQSEKYNFSHTCYSGGVPGHDNKGQFIDDFVNGKLRFTFCRVCKTDHIVDGAPIDLPERDPCCSTLPDWWPRDIGVTIKQPGTEATLNEPWEAWNMVWREYVFQDEYAKGLKKNLPNAPPMPNSWDKNFHEGREWESIGWKTGWWKCRTRREGGTIPEIRCRRCHRPKENENREILNGHLRGSIEYAEAQRDNIARWVNDLVAEGGKKDRAFVLEQMNVRREVRQGENGFYF